MRKQFLHISFGSTLGARSKCAAALFALCSMVVDPRFSAQAQSTKIPRIGYLSGSGNPKTPGPQVEGFRQGLHDLNYVEGKNILVEYRYVEQGLDRIPGLVAELVRLKVNVLVATFTVATRAAKEATKTIPIVMVAGADPVESGFVDSLARPGGNITGVARFTRELSGKRLELLKESIPRTSRVGVLWDGNAAPGPAIAVKEYEAAARGLKLDFQSLEVRGPAPDLDGAFQAAAKRRVNALIVVRNITIDRHVKRLVDFTINHRLPSMWEGSEFVEAGGLMSYSSDDPANYRRVAYYVDKILKGAKPADLPVEQPTKFELVFNLKTAKQIGVTIPQSVLYRADKVIK
jgi:putative tryptophan/tyrosine transport system substrate-binding protein